ncbi:MAG: hypothetical protein ACYC64_07580 [Armatimonadota bacterium]
MSALQNKCFNPDMELIYGGVPSGWGAGSSDGLYTSFGAYAFGAATNTYHARLTRTAATGSAWIVSSAFPVVGGKQIFANCYLRTSGWQNLAMSVIEYDSNWSTVAVTTLPALADGWSWRSYIGTACTTWNKVLAPTAAYAIVVIGGSSVANPAYIDLDLVSVSYH